MTPELDSSRTPPRPDRRFSWQAGALLIGGLSLMAWLLILLLTGWLST